MNVNDTCPYQTTGDFLYLDAFSNFNSDDFSLSFTVSMNGNNQGGFGVGFRMQNQNERNYYLLDMETNLNCAQLAVVTGGTSTALQQATYNLNANAVYNVSIVVVGKQIDVYFGTGTSMSNLFSVSDNTFLSGNIGGCCCVLLHLTSPSKQHCTHRITIRYHSILWSCIHRISRRSKFVYRSRVGRH